MKLYYFLILTTLGMTYVIGQYTINIQRGNSLSNEDLIEINYLKKEFQQQVSPAGIINFSDLYPYPRQMNLLDPLYTMEKSGFDHGEIYHTNRNCFKKMNRQNTPLLRGKAWIWEEFRCRKRKKLPEGFFQTSPFMHPTGLSYGYLAMKTRRAPFNDKSWLIGHMSFFHGLELNHLRSTIKDLIGPFQIIAKLEEKTLRDISKGKGSVLADKYLLAKINYPRPFSIVEYRFYYKSDLVSFLKDSPYRLQQRGTDKKCLYRDGELCWEYNVNHIMNQISEKTLIVLFGMVIIVIILVRIIFVKLMEQRREDERRRLALQVLTHEFRTPITSLILLVDKVSRRINLMPEEEQEDFLRMSGEVYRLQRLAEKSRNYLKVQNKNKLLEFNEDDINSIDDFLYEITAPYIEDHADKIQVNIQSDFGVKIDTYWLSIVIKNLIENAFVHGVAPVKVTASKKGASLMITVSDQGRCQFETLSQMAQEFTKGNKSTGTGLGLNIVTKVIKEMGGKVDFTQDPTTFKITLKNTVRL